MQTLGFVGTSGMDDGTLADLNYKSYALAQRVTSLEIFSTGVGSSRHPSPGIYQILLAQKLIDFMYRSTSCHQLSVAFRNTWSAVPNPPAAPLPGIVRTSIPKSR